MRLGARSFSDRWWNSEQSLSSIHAFKILDFGYYSSQIIHLWEFHQDYRVELSCYCMCYLDARDFKRGFCNAPQCVGLRIDKNISFQITSLDPSNVASLRIKSLTVGQ